MRPDIDTRLTTDRLVLRPFEVADAERVVAIQANWQVARMLRLAPWPVTLEATRVWLADHRREWLEGSAFRFAIERAGRVIGCADLNEIAGGRGDLGYWLDEAEWGCGLATEAGAAVVRFAFDAIGLEGIVSGHASDNIGSGKVLEKLGFLPAGEIELWSIPRGGTITQKRYRLDRA